MKKISVIAASLVTVFILSIDAYGFDLLDDMFDFMEDIVKVVIVIAVILGVIYVAKKYIFKNNSNNKNINDGNKENDKL